jgi:urease accessory protein
LSDGSVIKSCLKNEETPEKTANPFGRVSSLRVTASSDENGKPYLKELMFTAPFKVMSPFHEGNHFLKVMFLTASAGIMEGDTLAFEICAENGAGLILTTQAYEKIHQMKRGFAERKTKIRVSGGSVLVYEPLPLIPFADSAFRNDTEIFLEDRKSRLIYREIMSCGRAARGERFAYRFYHSLIRAESDGHPVYRENCRLDPARMPLETKGFFEGYTHFANLLLFHFDLSPQTVLAVRGMIGSRWDPGETMRETYGPDDLSGGLTRTAAGDYVIRIFGNRAQRLEEVCDEIMNIPEIKEQTGSRA